MQSYVLDWRFCGSVEQRTGPTGDEWVFGGTNLLVAALFTNLESGATVQEFLEWFPEVKREQVNDILNYVASSLEVPCPVQSDDEVLNAIHLAFSGCPRPEHFTNYDHCDECAEYDARLVDQDERSWIDDLQFLL